jgi:hypothetical protein
VARDRDGQVRCGMRWGGAQEPEWLTFIRHIDLRRLWGGMSLSIPTHHRWALILIFVLAMAAMAAACGDDDGQSDTTDTASPTIPVNEDSSGTPTPNGGTTAVTPGATQAGAGGELQSRIDEWLDGVNVKVTYDYASNFGGHPEGIYTIYYLDGASRHDWENIAGGLGVTLTTIVDGDEAYVCNIFEANPTCEVRSVEDTIDTRVAILIVRLTLEAISDEADTLAITALPDEKIAGLEAKCYETRTTGERITEGPPAEEIVTTCFSDDSVLLKVDHDIVFVDESLPDGDLLLEASEVGQAGRSDFDPPARVVGG